MSDEKLVKTGVGMMQTFRRIAALLFAAALFVVLVAACASPTVTPVPPTCSGKP